MSWKEKLIGEEEIKKVKKVDLSRKDKKEYKKSSIMKWFDTKEMKDKNDLSIEQIDYLKKPSLTIFGPFNMLFRRHWDIIITLVIINVLDRLNDSLLLALVFFVSSILVSFYYGIYHGRRLAWNRNKWENFDDFKRSEEIWKPWGVMFFIINIIYILYVFFA